MAIYNVTTREHAAQGGEFSNNYLYDDTRLIAIINYGNGKPYVSSKGHELKDVIGLIISPDKKQRNEAGWKILSSSVKELNMTAEEFDGLVRATHPHQPVTFFIPSSSLEKRVS
ncbi:hypothetical protein HYW20_02430 [Candidatus Woesearchaeota archaeon]|nr:hypothetical protein [Candidatus Woesearchaeota archaeon]